VEHETTPGFHRPSDMHRHAAQVGGHQDRLVFRSDVELLQEFGEADMRRVLVDDDTHRPIRGMGAEIDHRTREAGVRHCGHRDEKLPVEIGVGVVVAVYVHARTHISRLLALGRVCEAFRTVAFAAFPSHETVTQQ
jgi:hypothetical protein